MMNPRSNPYIGPRAFQPGEPFYGRDRELRSLAALLIAERIVLLHSPSGSGKTSLIQAGLRPSLDHENFNVLPIIRVNTEPPAETAAWPAFNRYALSTMLSLEEALPEEQRLSLQDLAGMTLDDYLIRHVRPEGASPYDVLIFDQFEEVLTTAPTDHENKLAFFDQLGKALRNKDRWALIAIREDYLGALAPYTRPIPGRFAATFRLDLLGMEGAMQAIQRPVQTQAVEFSPSAAQKLVDDLRRTHVQLPDGSLVEQLGPHVEPVELQVVCYRLWQGLSRAEMLIDESHLSGVGNVNQSLADYYSTSVKAIAQRYLASERVIREWFDRKIITPEGIRGQVLMGSESSDGLPNSVVRLLEDAHIIRGEKRAGKTWYELSHDRMIQPVRTDNAAWFEQNLSLFEQQAVLWIQQGRSEGLLLRGKALDQAEIESISLPLNEDEKAFLAACRKLRDQERREKLRTRIILGLAVGAIIAMVVAILFGAQANQATREAKQQAAAAQTAQANAVLNADAAATAEVRAQSNAAEAQRQAERALAGSLASDANAVMDSDHALALLLSLEAYRREDNLTTRSTLFQLLQFSPYIRLFGYNGSVTSVATSPDGSMIASTSCKTYNHNQCEQGEITLSTALSGKPIARLAGNYGLVNQLVFHQSGGQILLAAAGCVPLDDQNKGCIDGKGQISLWDVTHSSQPTLLADVRSGHKNLIKTIAISPDGRLLASGSFDTTIRLWDISTPASPTLLGDPLTGHSSFVNSLAFSNDGHTLVSAGDDQSILLWDISQPARAALLGEPIVEHSAPINSITFSPDGRHFASASDDNTIILWKWDAQARTLISHQHLSGHGGYVKSVAFNADGSLLASAGFDYKIILWNTGTGEQFGLPLKAHTRAINTVAFGLDASNNQLYLLSGGDDRVVIKWDLSTRQPLSQPVSQPPLPQSDPGQTAQNDQLEARVVDGQAIEISGRTEPLTGHTGAINSLSLGSQSTGRTLLASASDDQTVILWDVSDPAAAGIHLKLEGFESPVQKAYFDKDFLITIEKSGRAIQWETNPGAWFKLACLAAKRNLTRPEWEFYLPHQEYQKTCPANP